MSNANGVNNQNQSDPTSPDYWTTPGLDANGIDPVDTTDSSDPTQSASTVNKDELLREKTNYQAQLDRMSQGNPGRADIEKHIQDLDAQLATADTSSNWDPNNPNDPNATDANAADAGDPPDLSPVNPQYPSDDTTPTAIKANEATYKSTDPTETVDIHSNPGNKVNVYRISGENVVNIHKENPSDQVKVEYTNKQWVVHIKNSAGKEETYYIDDTDQLKSVNIDGGGTVDTSALTPAQSSKFAINGNAPDWAQNLSVNIPTNDDHHRPESLDLASLMTASAKSGDWKRVTDFLTQDPSMLNPNAANDVVRKVLTAVLTPTLVKMDQSGKAFDDQFGNKYGYINTNNKQSASDHNWAPSPGHMGFRDEFYWHLTDTSKQQIADMLQVIPPDVRTALLAHLSEDPGERHLGDAFTTEQFSNFIKQSLATDSSSAGTTDATKPVSASS